MKKTLRTPHQTLKYKKSILPKITLCHAFPIGHTTSSRLYTGVDVTHLPNNNSDIAFKSRAQPKPTANRRHSFYIIVHPVNFKINPPNRTERNETLLGQRLWMAQSGKRKCACIQYLTHPEPAGRRWPHSGTVRIETQTPRVPNWKTCCACQRFR